ncbi:hypothetical protein Vretimale_17820 [Volvox reticuliferus]|uniref:BTB domain-containing protein n=1 Tax=Volvox reticuliferus TaxID=1737510 RepID=A0A8J4FW14_9CHLO|nr:hypothetical protein Vretifemale_19045 [Volvox reticuliferus]GIM14965.1 hypothetical protein Vretimale_17820 [Volvox reticuliferus]
MPDDVLCDFLTVQLFPPQFSDFVLELRIHSPLQQEEGDNGESSSSSGPTAPSPIKRACTPAVSSATAAVAMDAAIGPPHPPAADAGGQVALARAADRPLGIEETNADENADAEAAAVVAVSGAGGPAAGEGRNMRFTNLQSREVPAMAAAALVADGGSGGRGERQGIKTTSLLTWPRRTVGNGRQVSAHGPGMSFATIERRSASSGVAPSLQTRGSAVASSAAAPLPHATQPSGVNFKAIRQPSPNCRGGSAGDAGNASAARGCVPAAPEVIAAVPAAGRGGFPGTGTSRGRGGSAAAMATSPATSDSSSASAITTAAGGTRAAQEPMANIPQERRSVAPSLSAGPCDSRNRGAESGEGRSIATAGPAADTLPGRDQRSEPPPQLPAATAAATTAITWKPEAAGHCTSGVHDRQVGAAATDPRVGRFGETVAWALCPAGPEDVYLNESSGSGVAVDEAAVAADEPLVMTALTTPSSTAAAVAGLAVPPETAQVLATSSDSMAADDGAADRSFPSSMGFTTVRSPAEIIPAASQVKLEGASAVVDLMTVTLARACSAPARQQQGPPLYDALSELSFGSSGDSGAATASGWEAGGGGDDILEPSGSWAGEDDGALVHTGKAAAAGTAAITRKISRRESWASGAAEGGGGSGGAFSCCGGGAAAAAAVAASGTVPTPSAATRSLGRFVAACTSSPPRPQLVRVYPVHAAVLAATSDYFRTLLQNWTSGLVSGSRGGSSGRGVLTMYVNMDQVEAAEMMLQFMYTGRLPNGLSPAELLSLLILADQYAVGRLLAAVDTAFAGLPLPGLSLEQLLRLYELPEVLLAGGALNSALSKLVDKLISELGDLELVMDCPARKAQLLGLPYEAVRLLLQSSETRVWNENTAVAALVEWMAGPAGQAATQEQRRQLVALLRLQHCTHSYLSYILPQVPWLLYALDPTRMLLALSWSRADASTRDVYTAERYFEQATTTGAPCHAAQQQHQRHQQQHEEQPQQRLHLEQEQPNHPPHLQLQHGREERRSGSGSGAMDVASSAVAAPGPSLPGFVPRPRPVSQRVTFDWSIDFATLQQLYSDSRVTRSLQVVTSEPAFFGGFFWWLRYDLDASQPPEYREHMGLACNVKLAGRKHSLPCVKVKATVCARQDAGVMGEGSYNLRKSFSYHVMNACPVGLWGFFGLTPDRDEASWRRFLFEGRVWLRCSIEECQ